MKIISIVGARPQFVKMAVLSRAIKKHNEKSQNKIDDVIIHTGQHYDSNMSDIFFTELEIPKPHFFLKVQELTHGSMTGIMMKEIESILIQESPDVVVLYGDTNSTLAGAISASKLHIPIAHIEAGLRSFNNKMPEEINRILTDRVSSLLFAPTDIAIENLKNEGFLNFPCKVLRSGDVMFDAFLYYRKFARKIAEVKIGEKFALATIHRAENTDDKARLSQIVESFNEISKTMRIILPLHPRSVKKISEFRLKLESNVLILPPLGYLEMIWLLLHCDIVMSDSGGLQKEAYFAKKPMLTLRDETEWTELLESANILVGADKTRILAGFAKSNGKTYDFKPLYGDGNSGEWILNEIVKNV